MDAAFTGTQIAQRRKAMGLTQRQLAEQLHVTDKAVSKWERGVNFPDLGLMENLSSALDTTPATLLGLEKADQNEVVKTMVRVHAEQLEEEQTHLRAAGWGAVVVALLLWAGFLQDEMYSLLGKLIPALIIGGLYLLFKSSAIRKWNWADILLFYGAVFPVILFNLGYLVRDHGFPDTVEYGCIFVCAICTQILCYRTMQQTWAKMLPIIGLVLYSLWHLANGSVMAEGFLCAVLCFAVWMILRKLDKNAKPLPVLKISAVCAVSLVLFGFLYYNSLVKAYVNLRYDHLVQYCETLLKDDSAGNRNYGPWKVSVYPGDGMVQFTTGGAGFGSETSYKGFYYSSGDAHIPFQGQDLPVDVYEPTDTGWWTDGTDNHGTTQRFRKNFYWFEAHF